MSLTPFWEDFGWHFWRFSDKNVVRIFDEIWSRFSIHYSSRGFPRECGLGAQGRGKGRGSVYKCEMLGGFRGLERQLGGFEREMSDKYARKERIGKTKYENSHE